MVVLGSVEVTSVAPNDGVLTREMAAPPPRPPPPPFFRGTKVCALLRDVSRAFSPPLATAGGWRKGIRPTSALELMRMRPESN